VDMLIRLVARRAAEKSRIDDGLRHRAGLVSCKTDQLKIGGDGG
jgi:hypothetical protein